MLTAKKTENPTGENYLKGKSRLGCVMHIAPVAASLWDARNGALPTDAANRVE